MLTLIEINKAVNKMIEDTLQNTIFKDVKIVPEDIAEPIVRPSIKIDMESSINRKFNSNCGEKTLIFRVYFFAKNKNKYNIDNLKMQDILETAFLDGLRVSDDYYIPISEVTSEVTDTVLVCSFDIYAVEILPETDTNDIMENLNIGLREEG